MAEDFGALAAIKDTLPQPVAPVVRTPKIDGSYLVSSGQRIEGDGHR